MNPEKFKRKRLEARKETLGTTKRRGVYRGRGEGKSKKILRAREREREKE